MSNAQQLDYSESIPLKRKSGQIAEKTLKSTRFVCKIFNDSEAESLHIHPLGQLIKSRTNSYQDSQIIEFTVEMAKNVLEYWNNTNRELKPSRYNKYCVEMKEGGWIQGNMLAPVAFFKDGNIASGQHRLAAQVLANKTVSYLCVFDVTAKQRLLLDKDNYSIIDTIVFTWGNSLGVSGAKVFDQYVQLRDISEMDLKSFGVTEITQNIPFNPSNKIEVINTSGEKKEVPDVSPILNWRNTKIETPETVAATHYCRMVGKYSDKNSVLNLSEAETNSDEKASSVKVSDTSKALLKSIGMGRIARTLHAMFGSDRNEKSCHEFIESLITDSIYGRFNGDKAFDKMKESVINVCNWLDSKHPDSGRSNRNTKEYKKYENLIYFYLISYAVKFKNKDTDKPSASITVSPLKAFIASEKEMKRNIDSHNAVIDGEFDSFLSMVCGKYGDVSPFNITYTHSGTKGNRKPSALNGSSQDHKAKVLKTIFYKEIELEPVKDEEGKFITLNEKVMQREFELPKPVTPEPGFYGFQTADDCKTAISGLGLDESLFDISDNNELFYKGREVGCNQDGDYIFADTGDLFETE